MQPKTLMQRGRLWMQRLGAALLRYQYAEYILLQYYVMSIVDACVIKDRLFSGTPLDIEWKQTPNCVKLNVPYFTLPTVFKTL